MKSSGQRGIMASFFPSETILTYVAPLQNYIFCS